jgi:tRNA A-37 threonylcarbamoyl transferase component Bud32
MDDTTRGFGAYTLESILMQGADGITYRAHHTATGVKVLVSIPSMPEEWDETAAFRDRFVASARAAQPLHHPGILDIREIGVDESSGMPFIAYEAVEGKNLRELTTHGRRLPDPDIALVGAAVADALDYAHAAGFVHGAVGPERIIVADEGVVKLTGFGVVNAQQSPTEMRGHAPGTGSYSSPEQIIGGVVDGRSDLFALGIVLFELVTGQHPFLASPPRDARDRIVADEAPLAGKIRPDAPGGFNSLIFKLLQKDPAKRPARGAEVAQSLRALHTRLLQPPPAPVAAPAPLPAAGPAGLSPVHLAVGAGLLVLAGAIAAVVLLRPAPAPTAAVPAAMPTVTSQQELSKALNDAEAALDAGDFARAERLLVEARRLDPLNARGLAFSQQARSMRDEKVKKLYNEGVAFGRAQRWQDAERRFQDVIAMDPDNVDAKDQLDELHELSKAGRHAATAPDASHAAVLAKPTATPPPPRHLRVYFESPLASGELAITLDRAPFATLPFDFSGAGGSGVIDKTFEMPHGRHQVLVTLHSQQGLTLGEQMFVLDFEPGHTAQLTIAMSGPRAVPRFSAAEVR